uniref:Uncharacterized protein n=1 Tax=Arundo donax TaxID=35708 RepID=A0A0A9HKI6_ARUDO
MVFLKLEIGSFVSLSCVYNIWNLGARMPSWVLCRLAFVEHRMSQETL